MREIYRTVDMVSKVIFDWNLTYLKGDYYDGLKLQVFPDQAAQEMAREVNLVQNQIEHRVLQPCKRIRDKLDTIKPQIEQMWALFNLFFFLNLFSKVEHNTWWCFVLSGRRCLDSTECVPRNGKEKWLYRAGKLMTLVFEMRNPSKCRSKLESIVTIFLRNWRFWKQWIQTIKC